MDAAAPLGPEALLRRVIAATDVLAHCRTVMVEKKNTEAALSYCHAAATLKAARSALPPLKLVSVR